MFSLGMVVFKDYDLVKNLIWNQSRSAKVYGVFEFINFSLILILLITLGLKEDGGTLSTIFGGLLFYNCVFFALACFSKYVLKNEVGGGGSEYERGGTDIGSTNHSTVLQTANNALSNYLKNRIMNKQTTQNPTTDNSSSLSSSVVQDDLPPPSLSMYEMYKNSILLGFIFGDRLFPEPLYFSDELKDKMCFNLGKRFALISTYCFAYREYMFAAMAMTLRFFIFISFVIVLLSFYNLL